MHPLLEKLGAPRLIKAFFYSVDGLKATWKGEQAFRQEICACVVLVPVALLMHVPLIGKALLIGSLLLVLIVELLNTAIEKTVDLITADKNVLAKKAKDAGSAAVLLALGFAALIWGAVLLG